MAARSRSGDPVKDDRPLAPGATFATELEDAPPDLVGTLTWSTQTLAGVEISEPSTTGIIELDEGPSSRYVKSAGVAPDEAGEFYVVWDDGNVLVREMFEVGAGATIFPIVDWRPTADDIAAHLRARTYTGDDDSLVGDEAGEFTETTRPTLDQVNALIDLACEDILAVFISDEVPEASYRAAKRAAGLKAALFVELSYFPEQTEDSSPYLQLRTLSDNALTTLVNTSNVRNLFGEDYSA